VPLPERVPNPLFAAFAARPYCLGVRPPELGHRCSTVKYYNLAHGFESVGIGAGTYEPNSTLWWRTRAICGPGDW
jgi:hypothetical protein